MRRSGAVVAAFGVFVMLVLGITAMAGAERPSKVKQGHPPVRFWASVMPKALPVRDAAPAWLTLTKKIRTADGAHPPALQELRIDLDRDVSLDSRGVPTCQQGFRDSKRHSRGWYERRCIDAQVGHGLVDVEVRFLDQPPLGIRSRIHIYNGGTRRGRVTFYVFMYFKAPITGAVVATAKSKVIAGGGTRIAIKFPMIGNGAGSITDLRMSLGKRIVSARCSERRLQFQGTAMLEDGTALEETTERACRPRGK
jgi:hypothetical protein